MKRGWNFVNEPAGGGQRFAEALGCISTEEYVGAIVAVHEALRAGEEARIVAQRVKVDPQSGEPLEDPREPGDYIVTGYEFTVGAEQALIERYPREEGEQAALDLAGALGVNAGRAFCETALQTKAIFDRIGGQAIFRPYFKQGVVIGVVCHYEHLVRGQEREPDASLDDPPGLPGAESESGPSTEEPTATSEQESGDDSFGAPDEPAQDSSDTPAETAEV